MQYTKINFFLNPIIHFKVDIVIHSAATVRFDENLSKVNFIVLIVLYQVLAVTRTQLLAVIQVIGSQVLGYWFFQLLQFLVSKYQLLYRLFVPRFQFICSSCYSFQFLGTISCYIGYMCPGSRFWVLAVIQVIGSQVLCSRFQLLQLLVSGYLLLFRLQVPRFQVIGSNCYSFYFLGTSCYILQVTGSQA